MIKWFGIIILGTSLELVYRSSIWSTVYRSKYRSDPAFGNTGMNSHLFDMLWRHVWWSHQPDLKDEGTSHEAHRWKLVEDFVTRFNKYHTQLSEGENSCVRYSLKRVTKSSTSFHQWASWLVPSTRRSGWWIHRTCHHSISKQCLSVPVFPKAGADLYFYWETVDHRLTLSPNSKRVDRIIIPNHLIIPPWLSPFLHVWPTVGRCTVLSIWADWEGRRGGSSLGKKESSPPHIQV